jgi:hypothetical protein
MWNAAKILKQVNSVWYREVDGVKKTTLFVRNDSIEIETFEGKTDTASIRW